MGTASGNKSIDNCTMVGLTNADGRQCSGRQRGNRQSNNQLAVRTMMTTTTKVLAMEAVTMTMAEMMWWVGWPPPDEEGERT